MKKMKGVVIVKKKITQCTDKTTVDKRRDGTYQSETITHEHTTLTATYTDEREGVANANWLRKVKNILTILRIFFIIFCG